MNLLMIITICLTVLIIAGSILFGLLRGRNRSLLRLGLVIISAVVAFLLRNVVAGWIGKINVQGQTVQEMLNSAINTSEMSPEVAEVALALINSAFGVVCFIITFVVLLLLTWAVAYPILKLAVKKEGAKSDVGVYMDDTSPNVAMPAGERPKDVRGKRYKKPGVKRLWGLLIGAVQGILVSFLIFVPVSGVAGTVGQVAATEVDGKPVADLSAYGLDEYNQSFIAKIYNATGGWFYRSMSKIEYGDGKTVSIAAAGDLAAASGDVLSGANDLSPTLDALNSEGGLTTDNVNKLGDSLLKIGNALNGLPTDAKDLLDDLAKPLIDTVTKEGEEPVIKIPDDFKVSDLDIAAVGQVVKDLAPYVSDDGEKPEMNEEFADHVVTALVNNAALLDIIKENAKEGLSLPVSAENKEVILAAINAKTDVAEETINTIKDLFGIDG